MSAAAVSLPAPNPAVENESLGEEARWQPLMQLPCRLTVDISMPNFRVESLLAMQPGSVLNTGWGVTRDIPLKINGVLIAWGELEGSGSRLTVRITELA
ncbi:MAG TPA: FliM/FliN family flagellar motor C-terminal domain-containing protein [Candidatus Sulfotelmatobacter sp.]|nr:FliM/FliN family flagellar motor C-terminal domain-containing protein [Candidatus Sulfotelmatobacter sp.]